MASARRIVKQVADQILEPFGAELVRKRPPAPCDSIEWLRKYPIRTFVDVGAHVGEYVELAAHLYPQASIWAIEPLGECVATLRGLQQKYPRLQVVAGAAGETEETATLHRGDSTPTSSLLDVSPDGMKWFPEATQRAGDEVQVKPLDSIVPLESAEREIFVKIDTQGFEDRVIRGGRRLLGAARIVQIEVSFRAIYSGQVLFPEIYDALRGLGLEFRGVKSQVCSHQDGAIVQAHAYFIRGDE